MNLKTEFADIKSQLKPNEDFIMRSRQDIERHVRMSQPDHRSIFANLHWGVAVGFAVLLIALTPITTAYANNSNPGDLLFPVDKALEKLELYFARTPEKQTTVHAKILQERVAELQYVSTQEEWDQKVREIKQEKALTELEYALRDVDLETMRKLYHRWRTLTPEQKQLAAPVIYESLKDQTATIDQIIANTDNPNIKSKLELLKVKLQEFSQENNQ